MFNDDEKRFVRMLEEAIVGLKLDLIRARIPYGHCPYAYYQPTTKRNIDCNEVGCDKCKRIFMENMEKKY